jgi:hypothetical protein
MTSGVLILRFDLLCAWTRDHVKVAHRLLAASDTEISVTRIALRLPGEDMQGVWPGAHCQAQRCLLLLTCLPTKGVPRSARLGEVGSPH